MIETPHEFRDPIHGLIHLTSQELSLVNSVPFQRLRRIRQLASANLVYPGALHTRFDHSLGTLHVAHLLLERLQRRSDVHEQDIQAIRLSALLHDIGHGPYSHVSEYLLEQFYVSESSGVPGVREKSMKRLPLISSTKSAMSRIFYLKPNGTLSGRSSLVG